MKTKKILEKMGIRPANEENFIILATVIKTFLNYTDGSLDSLINQKIPILSILNKLDRDELKFLKSEAEKINFSIEECQIKVQKAIPQDERKKVAAYYTIPSGTRLMAYAVEEFLKQSKRNKIILADPFLGSGLTLTTTIKKIGADKIEKVWGIELMPLPALIAFASLLHVMNGKWNKISVIAGDAFKEISEASSPFIDREAFIADVILTNPPFTRWKYLDEKYREYLLSVIEGLGYGKYITRREVSLQTLSMFLCDHILSDGGLLMSVLPASTFYTIYGRGYKDLLREKYGVYAVVESKSRASFSEDSGFKEVIIAAVKGSKRKPTLFIELNDDVEKAAKAIISGSGSYTAVDLHALPRFLDINWLVFFGENKLREIVIEVFKQGLSKKTLGYWDDVLGRDSIIRGVEMYGPEFFFIPNKYWKTVEEKRNLVKIESQGKELAINKEFLIKTLRKPSLYSRKIMAEVDTYMLSIPPVEFEELPSDLQEYIQWGIRSGAARPAINAYGKYWYSHVYKQMTTKKPFGQVFIPDKVDLLFKNRSVFANYTNEKVAASKNFYIIKGVSKSSAKLLAGWFNSTIFISVLILLGRKISETWTRFLENDYLELPLINLNKNDKEMMLEVVKNVDTILEKDLPPLWEQLGEEYRYELDLTLVKLIGIEKPKEKIEGLYHTLSNLLYKNE